MTTTFDTATLSNLTYVIILWGKATCISQEYLGEYLGEYLDQSNEEVLFVTAKPENAKTFCDNYNQD